ncbi:hypothetical protein JS44_02940 [Anoxybacillus flavithermus]|uniref:Uncharacterized protein n=1 Tax=Anoxybacillus flavithermus TaxID=33934 RepID=A0A094J384_9BACL|nr:hypothetical protein JS44_02940 [Anoxybacillus flavithermus]
MEKTLRFEFIGLTMLACTVIAMANVGAVGRSLVLPPAFYGRVVYRCIIRGACYIAIRDLEKGMASVFQRVLVGLYLIVLSLLLFSHEALFHILSRNGKLVNPSIIQTTWELFWKDVRGENGSFLI